jgi:hypothetical protein
MRTLRVARPPLTADMTKHIEEKLTGGNSCVCVINP